MMNNEKGFVGFEYMEVSAKHWMESLYVDSYENFGWEFEGEAARESAGGQVTLKFKRDRKLRNKAELTRLQRQFEACAQEIEALERSRTTTASIAAFTIGLAGTVLLGGRHVRLPARPAAPDGDFGGARLSRLDRALFLLSAAPAEARAADRPADRAEKR